MKLYIKNIFEKYNLFIDKIISINGWVKNIRFSKLNIIFIDINDGTCINNIQIIVKNSLDNIKNIKEIKVGFSINVIGKLVLSNGKKQNIEIISNKIYILGKVYNQKEYPISSSKYINVNFIRKFLHLRSRYKLFGSISRIRNCLYTSIINYMNEKEFLLIQTPIITSIDTEGSGNLFKISNLDIYNNKNNLESKEDFFKKGAFLTVSGQLSLEAYACSLSKVYNISPVFRSENSNTRKHLAEFWMLEIEIAFENIDFIIKLSIDLLRFIINTIYKNNFEDLNYINNYNKRNIDYILEYINNDFEIIEYNTAINILKKKFNKIVWGSDITDKYEIFLLSYFKKPLIIKNYPEIIKPFYMKLNKDNKTVSSFDILLENVGEVIGGSERENRMNLLLDSIYRKNMNLDRYNWYLDLRKYGSVEHSGLGLGIERLLLYITGMKNIKDVIPYPRYPNNLYM